MPFVATRVAQSEEDVAAFISTLGEDAVRRAELIDLLREDHEIYDQRGTTAIVRLRGWVLLALARTGITDETLVFVLEELDTGLDPYLVAAAARALRSYPDPLPAFATFVMQALTNMSGRNQFVSFDGYGQYATSSSGTSVVRELLETLKWLGPAAREILSELEALRSTPDAFPRKLLPDVDRAIAAIENGRVPDDGACCRLPTSVSSALAWCRDAVRREPVGKVLFEDQTSSHITYDEQFRGHTTVVVFFYTRCDNPLKCSLTITKLGRLQKLIDERGLSDRIHTAAITYDPGFDSAERMRQFGERRGLQLDPGNRVLRTSDGMRSLRRHFRLGVNFIESVVNRHRLEAYVLNSDGEVVWSFERLRWDERDVFDRALEVALGGGRTEINPPDVRTTASPALTVLASIAWAFFPKCAVCWAAYLGVFGIASLERIPYAPWLQPLILGSLIVSLIGMWTAARANGRLIGACLATLGALAILLSKA